MAQVDYDYLWPYGLRLESHLLLVLLEGVIGNWKVLKQTGSPNLTAIQNSEHLEVLVA